RSKSQQRKPTAKPVKQRAALAAACIKPDVRRAAARDARWNVSRQAVGRWGTGINHRRPVISSAKLHPDRGKLLTKPRKHPSGRPPCHLACRRALLDGGVYIGLADIGGQPTRRFRISQRDRQSLRLIRRQEFT